MVNLIQNTTVSTIFSQSWIPGKMHNERKKNTQQTEESENYYIFPFWRHGNLGTYYSLGAEFCTKGVVNAFRQLKWRMHTLLPWAGVNQTRDEHCAAYCAAYMLQCYWIQSLSWTWSSIWIICVDFIGDNPIFTIFQVRLNISLLCYQLKVFISFYF